MRLLKSNEQLTYMFVPNVMPNSESDGVPQRIISLSTKNF